MKTKPDDSNRKASVQVKNCFRLMAKFFPGLWLRGDIYYEFERKVEEKIITARKLQLIWEVLEKIKDKSPARRLLSNQNDFVKEFERLYSFAVYEGEVPPESILRNEYSIEEVTRQLAVYKDVVLEKFDVDPEDRRIKNFSLMKAPWPLWVTFVILYEHRRAFVLPTIFEDQEVYQKMRDEIKNYPGIFRILRDQMKTIDLAKHLNIPIDDE